MEVRTLEHKDIEKTVAPEEVVSINFIEAEIILVMLNLFVLTLVLANSTMA